MTSPGSLHPGGFGHVPIAALRDDRLTPIDRAVFAAVTSGLSYTSGGGRIRSRRFAERAGVSARKALESARRIAELGYWTMEFVPGGGYRFDLVPTGDADRTAAEREEDAIALDPSTTGRLAQSGRREDGRFIPEVGDALARRSPRVTGVPPRDGGPPVSTSGVPPSHDGGPPFSTSGVPPPQGGTPQRTTQRRTQRTTQRPAMDIAALFDEFWTAYPRRNGKDAARRAFERRVRGTSPAKYPPADAATIIEGARRYAADPNLPEPKFIPYPATWLNRGGWDDEPEPSPNGKREPAAKTLARAEALRAQGR